MQNTHQTNTPKTRLIALGFLIILSVLALSLLSCSSKKTTEQETFEKLNVGDIITFGAYQWKVLDVKSDRALILAERSIGEMRYSTSDSMTKWRTSAVRTWLQEHLASNAFNDEERTRAIEVINKPDPNPYYDYVDDDQDVRDRIFLLTAKEVVQYFGDSGQLGTSANLNDQYNANRIIEHSTIDEDHVWWLRTSGRSLGFQPIVTHIGVIYLGGVPAAPPTPDYPGNTRPGVRPAMWIKM